jgi:general secretion pathway protein M
MTVLTTLRAQVLSHWQTLSPREQRSMSVLGALLGLVLFWSVAIAPARQTLIDSDNRRAQLGQQQAHMLALQAQAQALKTRTPLSREEALRSLQSLTPGAQIQLQVQGDRVTVQLKAVPAPVLATWLAQARLQAQALPLEAHLTRAATATNAATPAALSSSVVWDGTLVLSLPNRASTGN